MSNLFKSKFLLGVMIALVAFVGDVALTPTAKAAADTCTITTTLRVGSKGAEVKCLQAALDNGLVGDGVFGPKTKASVMAFQSAHGLVADGVFGSKSRAAWMGTAMTSYPAGCTSGVGYSPTTGQPCTGTVMTTTLPAGCTSTAGFSPTTGVNCSTGTTTTTTTTSASGPVSAMLASDNPAAGNIVAGQATADLLHVTFTGTGTLTSVTLKRTGISDQSTLTNVYLYSGITRLTDGYSFNNNGDLTMNGLNIPVNGSLTVSVKADVYASTASYSLGVNMTGYTALGGTATSTSIMGNVMFIATGANVSTIVFTTNTPPTAPTVNPGAPSFTVWSAPINVVGTHSLWLKSANFRIIGSAPTDALANVKLYKDGVALNAVATLTSANGSNYYTFDFSGAPVELTNGNHTMDVRADVQKGSARTIQLSVQQASDWMVYDSQVGVNVVLGGISNAGYVSISISQGSLTATVDPTFNGFTKITGGSTNTAIAKFKLHAYGEDMKINTLTFTPTLGTPVAMVPSGTTLQNVTAYFNGSQVGTQTATGTSGTPIILTPGSQMIVPAGVDSYLEIRADIRTSGSVNYTDGSIYASLIASTNGAEGMNSHNSLAIPGVTGNTLRVQTGTLAVGTNTSYANQVMNQNTSNVKLGSYTIQNQSTSEAVRVTSLRVTETFASPLYVSGDITLSNTGTCSSSGAACVETVTTGSAGTFSVGDLLTFTRATTNAVGTVTAVGTSTVTVDFTTGTGATVGSGAVSTTAPITAAGKTATAYTYVNGLRTSETSGNASTPVPVNSDGVNTFSPDFTLAPGASKTIDVMADLGGASLGTIVTKLAVQGVGVSSNVSVFSNGATSLTDVTGQTITMASGTLTAPTIVSSASTTGQYVAAGSTGVTNVTQVGYKLVSSNGTANVTEMKFTATGPVTSVTVGGQTASLAGSTIDVTGLNITVPNGSTGVTVPVMVSYGSVGAAGIGTATSGTTSTITMSEIDYTIGGTAHTDALTSTPGASPTMKLVGSKPVLTATTTNNSGLFIGENHLYDVTVTPDSHGEVLIKTLQFAVNASGFASGTATLANPRLTDGTTTITDFTCLNTGSTASATDMIGATDTVTCTDATGYPMSSAKTFSLYGTVAAGSGLGAANTSSVTTALTASSNFAWADSAGGGTVSSSEGAGYYTSTNTSYLYNYPTATWSVKN